MAKARVRGTDLPIPAEAYDELVARGVIDPAEEVVAPSILTPTPSTDPRSRWFVEGAWFDVDAVERVFRALCDLSHLTGRWAGRPLRPDAWQVVYLIGPVFGWKNADGLRVIRTAWIEVPRKSGKSTITSGLTIVLLCADGEAGAEVYAAAASTEQARRVFEPAKAMAAGCDRLRGKVRPLTNVLKVPATGSIFRVLSKLADVAHGLNVHAAVIDEVHVIRSRGLVDALETGTGARDQPLIIFLTTSDDGSKTTIYDEKRSDVEQLADGRAVALDTYGAVWALPADDRIPYGDVDAMLAQALTVNPGAGRTVGVDYLRSQCERATRVISYRPTFERLHLNRRRRADTAGVDLDRWAMNAGAAISERALRGRRCYGGLDLASTTDFAAWCLVFPNDELSSWREDESGELVESTVAGVDVVCRLWIPEVSVAKRTDVVRSAIEQWAEAGWVRITSGDAIDFEAIEADISADAERFDVAEFAFDPWQAENLRQRLFDGGLAGWKCPQQMAHLAGPWAELERLYLRYGFHHGGNPALEWMAANVVVKADYQERVKPEKRLSHESIDGMVAATMAVGALIRERDAEGPAAASGPAPTEEDRSIYAGGGLDI